MTPLDENAHQNDERIVQIKKNRKQKNYFCFFFCLGLEVGTTVPIQLTGGIASARHVTRRQLLPVAPLAVGIKPTQIPLFYHTRFESTVEIQQKQILKIKGDY